MLGRSVRITVAAAAVVAPLVLMPVPAAAQASGDPDHTCAVAPDSVECFQWLSENPQANDPSNPVCRHLGAYVPCRSRVSFGGRFGWWVGDVRLGRFGWGYLNRHRPQRIDDSEKGRQPTRGCWGWLWQVTGGDTGVASPGDDPDVPGAWYKLMCLGDQQWSESIDDTALPGFHGELSAWRATGSRPAGDPVRAALNARAALGITAPTIVTAPPATGSVPLGMPVWLAVDESDPSGWGRLTGSGCDGSLCVSIEAWVHELEWRLGDGTVVRCSREQNEAWRPGLNYLEPSGVCHHYYQQPSRDLPDGRYPVELVAHWRTYWQAPSLGRDGFLDHSLPPVSTSVRVVEVQVLVTR